MSITERRSRRLHLAADPLPGVLEQDRGPPDGCRPAPRGIAGHADGDDLPALDGVADDLGLDEVGMGGGELVHLGPQPPGWSQRFQTS